VSADTDFGRLSALQNRAAPSVLLIADRAGPLEQSELILANLSEIAQQLASGCVVVMEDARIRVRRLPILP